MLHYNMIGAGAHRAAPEVASTAMDGDRAGARTGQHSVACYSVVQHSTAQYSTVQYSIM